MKQFDDLVSAITIYVCPDDKKEMKRYVYKAKALKVILIFILLLYIVSTILNFHIVAGVAGVFSVVGMIRYIKLRKTTSKRVKSTILVEGIIICIKRRWGWGIMNQQKCIVILY